MPGEGSCLPLKATVDLGREQPEIKQVERTTRLAAVLELVIFKAGILSEAPNESYQSDHCLSSKENHPNVHAFVKACCPPFVSAWF